MDNQEEVHTYNEPLRPWTKRALLASVIFFHVGGGYALTLIQPTPLVIGDTAPMEVSFINSPPSSPEPEPPPPELESMIEPPLPDLPPPVFPVVAPPPKPQPPKPPPPKPQVTTAPPTDAPPQPSAAPPAPQAGPKTVDAAQVGWLVRPNPVYPLRARRAGNQGTAMVKAYVDTTGRPSQVTLQTSSGFPELDEQALSSVRASQLRHIPEPMWVIAPIGFNLQ
jgi:periplasmic protein TonB